MQIAYFPSTVADQQLTTKIKLDTIKAVTAACENDFVNIYPCESERARRARAPKLSRVATPARDRAPLSQSQSVGRSSTGPCSKP